MGELKIISKPIARSTLRKKQKRLTRQEEKKIYQEFVDTQQTCMMCGSGNWLQVHHIRYATSRLTYKGNLALLCQSCHSKAHSNEKKYKPMLVEIVNEFYGLDLPVNYKPY